MLECQREYRILKKYKEQKNKITDSGQQVHKRQHTDCAPLKDNTMWNSVRILIIFVLLVLPSLSLSSAPEDIKAKEEGLPEAVDTPTGNNTNWTLIIITILCSSTMGAIIVTAVKYTRHRRPPIGLRIDTIPVFRNKHGTIALKTHMTISDGRDSRELDNLYFVKLTFRNKSNKDMELFPVGINLPTGSKAIYVEPISDQILHEVIVDPGLRINDEQDEVFLTLKPFNRKDLYVIRLYVICDDTYWHYLDKIVPIVDSSAPKKFVKIRTVGETLREVMSTYF